MAKRKIPVFHSEHTIQKALSDINGGLTLAATARKYGVHYSTVYVWTQKGKKKTQYLRIPYNDLCFNSSK